MMLVGCGIISPTEVSIQKKALVQEMSTKDINKVSFHQNKTTAVIHMGPHKTGTTSVQSLTGQFINVLKEDGYHLPYDWASVTRVGRQIKWNLQLVFLEDLMILLEEAFHVFQICYSLVPK